MSITIAVQIEENKIDRKYCPVGCYFLNSEGPIGAGAITCIAFRNPMNRNEYLPHEWPKSPIEPVQFIRCQQCLDAEMKDITEIPTKLPDEFCKIISDGLRRPDQCKCGKKLKVNDYWGPDRLCPTCQKLTTRSMECIKCDTVTNFHVTDIRERAVEYKCEICGHLVLICG
jgi:hypothetical protein